MTLSIEELRVWYDGRLREHLPAAGDHAVSVPGGKYLWKLLEEHQPRRILEMGSGFTTLLFRHWQAQQMMRYPERKIDPMVATVEEDKHWLSFVSRLLHEHEFDASMVYHLETFRGGPVETRWDLIFIDGPAVLMDRLALSRWLAGLLRPEGQLVFDDWRPRFANRMRASLEPLGFTFSVAEHTRCYPRDKAIAVARKTKPAKSKPPALRPMLKNWRRVDKQGRSRRRGK